MYILYPPISDSQYPLQSIQLTIEELSCECGLVPWNTHVSQVRDSLVSRPAESNPPTREAWRFHQ